MQLNRFYALILAVTCAWTLAACGGGSGGAPADVSETPPAPSVAPDQPTYTGTTHDVTSSADSGAGSLRECLSLCVSGDRIEFDDTMSGVTIELNSPLVIDCDIHIQGPPSGDLKISGEGRSRVLEVEPGVTAVIRDLWIQNGSESSAAGIELDGAVLFLERVVIHDNAVSSTVGRGGGIQTLNASTLVMTDCIVQRCEAFNGGGIAHDGGLLIARRCAFVANNTTGNAGAAVVTQARCMFENCIFEGNVAPGGWGGAIFISGGDDDGDVTMIHCTLDNNEAEEGGAIANSEGVLRLFGVAIGAHTTLDPAVNADVHQDLGVLVVRNTYISNGSNTPIVDGIDGNRAGTTAAPLDLGLMSLTDLGGPIPHMILETTSILIDSISPLESLNLDGQPLLEDSSGNTRPAGAASDIGSTEARAELR